MAGRCPGAPSLASACSARPPVKYCWGSGDSPLPRSSRMAKGNEFSELKGSRTVDGGDSRLHPPHHRRRPGRRKPLSATRSSPPVRLRRRLRSRRRGRSRPCSTSRGRQPAPRGGPTSISTMTTSSYRDAEDERLRSLSRMRGRRPSAAAPPPPAAAPGRAGARPSPRVHDALLSTVDATPRSRQPSTCWRHTVLTSNRAHPRGSRARRCCGRC